MKMLITIEEFNKYKSRDKIPCECERCKNTYYIGKNLAQRVIKGTKESKYCSKQCGYKKIFETNSIFLKCAYCHNDFRTTNRKITLKEKRSYKNVFCSLSCSAKFYGKLRTKEIKKYFCKCCSKEISKGSESELCHSCKWKKYTDNYILRWKSGLEKGYTGKTFLISIPIRKYLTKKYNNKCCKCGWDKIHPITNKIPLEVNHIDGNPANCKEENLELICPNCHALTPNFRNLNKNSCRIRK